MSKEILKKVRQIEIRTKNIANDSNFVNPLKNEENFVGTHHIGASTDQAQAAVASGVVEILDAFSRGNIQHCVNMDT